MLRKLVLVTGAGGFIGHHLVSYLVGRGYCVRGVDIKMPDMRRPLPTSFCNLIYAPMTTARLR